MKKVFLLSLAIGVALTSFGASKTMKAMPKQQAILNPALLQHAQVNNSGRPAAFLMKHGKAVATQTIDTLDAIYYAPYSLYNYNEYGSVPYYRMIMSPLMDSVPFYSPYGKATWSEEGQTKASNAQIYWQPAGDMGGDYVMPTVSVSDKTVQTYVYKFNDYTFGKDWIDLMIAEYPAYASSFDYFHAMAWPFAWTLTQCGGVSNKYWTTDSKGAAYESADDLWFWGGRGYGEYMFGTGLQNPNTAGATIDTMGVLVSNISPLWMDTAYLNILTKFDSIAWAADDTLKLTLYAVEYDETAKKYNILRDSIYGVAYAGLSDLDYTFGSQGYYWAGQLAFSFEKKDILGTLTPTPAVPYGDFWAELTGFEDLQAEFGIWADGSQFNLGTYYLIGDSLVDEIPITYESKQDYLGGHNIMLGFQAYWPSMEFLEDTVYIPLEGGEATYADGTPVYFYSSEGMDDVEFFTNDAWLSIELDDSNWEKSFTLDAAILATANTAVRYGAVIFYNTYGNYQIMYVKQGNPVTGLKDVLYNTQNGGVEKMIVDGKLVIIRNGEAFSAQGAKLK